MKTTQIKTGRTLALLLAGLLVTAGAMAEKPDFAGGGKNGKAKHNQVQEHQEDESKSKDRQVKVGGYFQDEQRTAAHNYYSEQYRVGKCPPGLAKKNNGCMPPGQARKWSVGQPLARDVVYYPVPPAVVVQLGVPPSGQRYVRVASDILLIAIGTRMVIDGMQDLGRQ
jgi:Ni/Co efflux regulator RcnB